MGYFDADKAGPLTWFSTLPHTPHCYEGLEPLRFVVCLCASEPGRENWLMQSAFTGTHHVVRRLGLLSV